jgi:WD40 repeat protein
MSTYGNDTIVWLWRVSDGKRVDNNNMDLEKYISEYAVSGLWAFSPDRTMKASLAAPFGDNAKKVALRRVSDGQLLRTLEGHTERVCECAFSPDGTMLASADNTVRLWRVSDGKLLRTFEGHKLSIGSMAFSPDGTILASSAQLDNAIKLWRVSDGELLGSLEGHEKGVNSVAFSPNGTVLASASDDKTVRLWQLKD